MMFTNLKSLVALALAALELHRAAAHPILPVAQTHSQNGMLRQNRHRAFLRRTTTSSNSTTSAAFDRLALFPAGHAPSASASASTSSSSTSSSSSWTTAPELGAALPLADATFNLFDDEKALTHAYTAAPDGTTAMQVNYAKGSFDLDHAPYGGVSFYATGPDNVNLTEAKEATFGYSVFFQDDFDFVKGGKLPGLYGGNDAQTAISCSGGRISASCFSARLMWRTAGAGELYTYLPPTSSFPSNTAQCTVPPFSTCNPTYGASVGRGSFAFAKGAWNTVAQRVRLNDAGAENGELELFANGRSVVNVSGLVLRDGAEGRIWGIQMQSFFGGHDASYESPKDQSAWFKDFSVAITEKL